MNLHAGIAMYARCHFVMLFDVGIDCLQNLVKLLSKNDVVLRCHGNTTKQHHPSYHKLLALDQLFIPLPTTPVSSGCGIHLTTWQLHT